MTIIDTQRIADFLASHNLSKGMGTIEGPCSIAAINLAISGRLTDEIPACMSPVIGNWIIVIQDAMPSTVRNSPGWKALLPLAAGTGRYPALEQRRAELLLNWMWCNVLPQLRPLADANGFGDPWRKMLAEPTARAAAAAARAAASKAAWAAAAWAAAEAVARAAVAENDEFWTKADPVAMLKQLIDCS